MALQGAEGNPGSFPGTRGDLQKAVRFEPAGTCRKDGYLEFFTGADGDLEIRPGGTDFFKDAREKLLEGVLEADVQKLREATSKTNLIHLAEQEESIQLSFSRQKNGVPVPYSLQTIRTRESDHHHLIIGVRQERDDGDERA